MTREDVIDLVTRLQAGLAEVGGLEAKRATRDVPSDIAEALCAFSNTANGGTILLGIDERSGFEVTGVDDVEHVANRVAQICRDEIEPALQPVITSEEIDGRKLIIVDVSEIMASTKPAYVKSRGLVNGGFLRVAGSNRRLAQYEVGVMLANRDQPRHDAHPIAETSVDDLDRELTERLLARIKSSRPVLARADRNTLLTSLGVVHRTGMLTLAGLLALGRYPQQYVPQLDITFTFFATPDHEALPDGTRFLDSASIDGPIPVMVDEAMARIGRNMRRRAVIRGSGRIDLPDYPEAALREAIANAVMHRDYSEASRGTQIRIRMSPDRIEIDNPGGLFGPVSRDALEAGESVSSSRNATLAKLLEDVMTTDGRAVAENRASGLPAMLKALRDAHLPPAEFIDDVSRFTVRFRSGALVDDETLQWIASLDQTGLTDGQLAALALVREGRPVSNSLYRAASGCDAATATHELVDLRNRRLIVRTGVGHRATWRLNPAFDPDDERQDQLPGRLTGEGRERQLLRIMQTGPKSRTELTEATGLGRQSVLNYLTRLRDRGLVEPTTEKTRSRATKWRLREASDVHFDQPRLPFDANE